MHHKKNRNSRYNDNKRTNFNFPSPQILENYERLVKGSAEKIIDMIDVEQDHRQKWENKALNSYIISYRFGQIISFFSVIAIIILSIYVYKTLGNQFYAISILITGLTFHLICIFLSIRSKSFFIRPKQARKNYNERRK